MALRAAPQPVQPPPPADYPRSAPRSPAPALTQTPPFHLAPPRLSGSQLGHLSTAPPQMPLFDWASFPASQRSSRHLLAVADGSGVAPASCGLWRALIGWCGSAPPRLGRGRCRAGRGSAPPSPWAPATTSTTICSKVRVSRAAAVATRRSRPEPAGRAGPGRPPRPWCAGRPCGPPAWSGAGERRESRQGLPAPPRAGPRGLCASSWAAASPGGDRSRGGQRAGRGPGLRPAVPVVVWRSPGVESELQNRQLRWRLFGRCPLSVGTGSLGPERC